MGVLGFRALGFRVWGFWDVGFGGLGFRVWGLGSFFFRTASRFYKEPRLRVGFYRDFGFFESSLGSVLAGIWCGV